MAEEQPQDKQAAPDTVPDTVPDTTTEGNQDKGQEVPDQAHPNKDAMAQAQREHWARPVEHIETDEVPPGASAVNVDGREVVNPTHGFGQLWRRTYRVKLPGVQSTPAEVMAYWKEHFPEFQPEENRFLPTRDGVQPGELVYIDAKLINAPGLGALTPMASGVMVIYADDESFTVMTPEGFPVSGFNTFSVYEEDEMLYAQVQGLERATDPIYEFGYRLMGGEAKQDRTWKHVLRSLAARYGIDEEVEHAKTCLDPGLQWQNVGNVWKNAFVRTTLYKATTPIRWLFGGRDQKS
jgi:hypothetical protein